MACVVPFKATVHRAWGCRGHACTCQHCAALPEPAVPRAVSSPGAHTCCHALVYAGVPQHAAGRAGGGARGPGPGAVPGGGRGAISHRQPRRRGRPLLHRRAAGRVWRAGRCAHAVDAVCMLARSVCAFEVSGGPAAGGFGGGYGTNALFMLFHTAPSLGWLQQRRCHSARVQSNAGTDIDLCRLVLSPLLCWSLAYLAAESSMYSCSRSIQQIYGVPARAGHAEHNFQVAGRPDASLQLAHSLASWPQLQHSLKLEQG